MIFPESPIPQGTSSEGFPFNKSYEGWGWHLNSEQWRLEYWHKGYCFGYVSVELYQKIGTQALQQAFLQIAERIQQENKNLYLIHEKSLEK